MPSGSHTIVSSRVAVLFISARDCRLQKNRTIIIIMHIIIIIIIISCSSSSSSSSSSMSSR